MINSEELVELLETEFPTCTFSINKKRIVLHYGGIVDGKDAFSFDKTEGYELGLHQKIFDFLNEKGYTHEIQKQGSVYITYESDGEYE